MNDNEKILRDLIEDISYIRAKVESLDKIEKNMDEIEKEVTNIKVKQMENYDTAKTNSSRLSKLEDTSKWLGRSVIGAFITAIVGFFLI